MLIAIEGCTHGELSKTYDTIKKLEEESGKKVDLLLCCGDFQATRNLADLQCMAVPDKYKDMCSFYPYYSGEKRAPVTTVFIGGNHEASNYLQELPYGGWVAPNIYYMGYAGVIKINGRLRVGGLSGIFKGHDYLRGRYERPPYAQDTLRSVYHVRNLDTFRLKQLADDPPDVMMSHDWPRGVYNHGDVAALLRWKSFFREEIERDQLGSRPAQEVLQILKSKYWFSAHLHVKFPALVEHEDGSATRFLALDKCLPRRRFLQVLEIGPELEEGEKIKLEHDPAWLAILRSTDHLLSVGTAPNHMPGPNGNERWDFKPTEEEVTAAVEAMEGDTSIQPDSFTKSVPAFDPQKESLRDLHSTMQPEPRQNSQTVEFCRKLEVRDPLDVLLEGNWPEVPMAEMLTPHESSEASVTNDEIELPEDSDEEAEPSKEAPPQSSSKEPPGGGDNDGFVVDASPCLENLSKSWDNVQPQKKKLKRRNQAIYTEQEDE